MAAITNWPDLAFWHSVFGGMPAKAYAYREHGGWRNPDQQSDGYPASCRAIDRRVNRSPISATHPGGFECLSQPAARRAADACRRLSWASGWRSSHSCRGLSSAWIRSQPAPSEPGALSGSGKQPDERISSTGGNQWGQPEHSLPGTRREPIPGIADQHCNPAANYNLCATND